MLGALRPYRIASSIHFLRVEKRNITFILVILSHIFDLAPIG